MGSRFREAVSGLSLRRERWRGPEWRPLHVAARADLHPPPTRDLARARLPVYSRSVRLSLISLAPLFFIGSACSSGSTAADASITLPDAGSEGAEATIGPSGGTLTLGAVALSVPAGAVTAPTTFRIRPLSATPSLPSSMTVVSAVFRLEPAQTFQKPIRVTLTVDPSKVPSGLREPTDGLLLMKAPSGTNDFLPVGAAGPEAAAVVADVTSFSDIVATYLRIIGCSAVGLEGCTGSCDPITGSCTGSCGLRTSDALLSATCQAAVNGDVSCSCSSSDPARMPVVSGPLRLIDLLSGWSTLTMYTFLERCGWPCQPSTPDAGVAQPDATVEPDAGLEPDAGTPDSGARADTGVAPDAGTWMSELVGSDPAWHAFTNFRVGNGWISWVDPTRQELHAMHTDTTGHYMLPGIGSYSRFQLELAVNGGPSSRLGLVQLGATMPRFIDVEVDATTTRELLAPAAYVGITPTAIYTNDPHYDPLTGANLNPFSSIPLTGGRATVLNDHLNAGPIETDPTGVFFYGSDRDMPSICGLYSERGGFPLIPDEVLCRSGSQPIRITPGFVLWQHIDAQSMPSLTVMRRSDNRIREFTEVRRAFAASGDWVYYLDSGNNISRALLDGDGTPEPLGVQTLTFTLHGMAAGGDGYIYWAFDSGTMGSIYRMAVP